MDDRELLIRAIRNNPDEDTPRLMYADYLDEHGEPDRAAFIRAQCELARLPERPKLHLIAASTTYLEPNSREMSVEGVCSSRPSMPETYDLLLGQQTFFGAILMSEHAIMAPASEPRTYRCRFLVTGHPDPNAARITELRRIELRTGIARVGFVDIPDLGPIEVAPGQRKRGFVDWICLDAPTWTTKGDQILSHEPVREVRISHTWEPRTLEDVPALSKGFGYFPNRAAGYGYATADRGDSGEIPSRLFNRLKNPDGTLGGFQWWKTRGAATKALHSAFEAEWAPTKFALFYGGIANTYIPDFNFGDGPLVVGYARNGGLP